MLANLENSVVAKGLEKISIHKEYMQEKYNRFLKIKIIKKRKEKMEEERKKKKRKTPQNCKSPTQRQMFTTTIKSVIEYTHIHIHP